ncbi:hypothetical protein NDA14_000788 [Ustilago hordei]|uniref:Uncharacterized protein n=1 Tax=Ustilago hordei TaxID=120017 RepID=I2G0A8_USTHO|nr:uncharacterized protein UHO2_03601 [Ustilago hordei]KAJ1044183.1 hypothetical protein NDA10_004086 [Ustilago hordei]KAJ1579020.1 hypothetical protein NDA15_004400 [Ustilago hordei]KAJ1580848.1 hypothetical protein NDA12_007620 [Ustilago hordei]KAJ1597207.1 hypothetical protein NDA14_000788 [Ustilago hordei]UTT91986.1 hypothetical protein NDA17_003815 [Ustilago hordei]
MPPSRDQQVPELSYLPSYAQTRAPPPSGPPPAYANVIGKVYPYSLRPVVLITSFCTFLYLLLISISNFKDINNSGNNTIMNVFGILTGALLMTVAIIEVIGFVGALKTNLKLATLYSRFAIPGFVFVISCEIINIVGHYSFKDRIINDCVSRNTGAVVQSSGWGWLGSGGSSTVMSAADAQNYCNRSWKYASTWEIVWLIVTIVLGVPFVMFSFAFVRQLQDPASVRVRESNLGWWDRRNNQPPSAQYGTQYSSGPYDPQSQSQAYSYPPVPYGAGMYAPPSSPPPNGVNRDLPGYKRGDMAGEFDDRKSPVTSPIGYGYSGNGRPSSSRDRDPRQNDAAKDSQVTIRLDDDVDTKSKSSARRSDDDDTPRV